MILNFKKN